MTAAAFMILALVTLQRLGELCAGRAQHTAAAGPGAHEVGAAIIRPIVAVHACWLAVLWLLAPGQPMHVVRLVLFVALQARTGLGHASPRRALDDADHHLARRAAGRSGPYRWVNHPNYVVVARDCGRRSSSGCGRSP